ncbi:exonuclease [Ralstonia phage PQ43W]
MSNPAVAHSKLSLSGRERWRACPASVALSAGVADTSSPASEEGTRAHTVAEWYVRKAFNLAGADTAGNLPAEQIPPEGLDLKGRTADQWNAELRIHARAYVEFIQSLIPPGVEAFVSVEQRVAIPSISEHLFGTADCLIWIPSLALLIVVDYKYGFVEVDVGTIDSVNAQLAAYGVGGAETFGLPVKSVGFAVFQPHRPLGGPPAPLYVGEDWLTTERARLAAEVAAVSDPGAPQPGDHCRYCKGKSKCTAVHQAVGQALAVYAGTRDLLSMTDDELVTVYAARKAFKAFWEDVEERIGALVKKGHAGLQVKESQGRQMWRDAREAGLTLLALGRQDLVQAVALSEAIGSLPEGVRDALIKRSAPSRSIELVSPASPNVVIEVFKKYSNTIDNGAQNK